MPFLRLPSRTARLMACAATTAVLAAAGPVCAKGQTEAPLGQTAPGTQIDSVRLLELLVQNGLVTREQAEGLIANATVPSPVPAPAQTAALPPPAAGSQRIQFIPEIVRQQIKDELRAEVTQQARTEGWAQPDTIPDWVSGITLTGDVRVRAEGVFQDADNLFTFPDFAAINNGPGFDITLGGGNAPFLNTTEDRQRARVRARLGLEARITDWVSAEVRIATGNDASPVSTNQTLGASGGYGAKYDLWLDRAAIRLTPMPGFVLTAGRAANPFWTSDLLFDDDLNFDGVSARYDHAFKDGSSSFLAADLFPVFNTDFDFGDRNVPVILPDEDGDVVVRVPRQFESRDQYLLGVQAGGKWGRAGGTTLSAGLGYFHFVDAEGEISSPCFAPTADTVCDTDSSRAAVAGFGNSQFAIRDIVMDPENPDGAQLQYFGRASQFQVLNARAQLDFAGFDAFHVRLEGDLVYNLGYDEDDILARGPVNNFDADEDGAGPDLAEFDSGGLGWTVKAVLGARELQRLADWRVSVGYRYLEADAVIDSFTDSDFHLGGTNAQGFMLGGEFGLARNTWVAARWLSANEVSGPPYANDVVQLDLNAKF